MILNIIIATVSLFSLGAMLFSLYKIRADRQELLKKEKEMEQKAYEALVLKEIGERIGYELNTEKILETIIGSLSKLIPYSVASYVLIAPDPEKLIYRVHVNESVGHKFLDNMKDHLLFELNKISSRVYLPASLEEKTSGTIIEELDQKLVSSLWLAPLKINNRGVGVLAIASYQPNLYKGAEMDILVKLLTQANQAVSQLEEVLHNEQSKILSMISSMVDGVVMLDTENNITAINAKANEILGIDHSYEVTIKELAQKLADKFDLRAKIDESIKTNSVVTINDMTINNKFYTLILSPAKDQTNKIIGAVFILRDVSSQKELERVREDFMAMMVHELRAPLSVISGTTDMILRQPTLAQQEQGTELLTSMKNSTATMLNLVNDLLDAAKIEAGKFQILVSHGDLSEVIRDRVNFFQQLASPKQISLSWVESPFPLLAQFDKERIAQVLNNLLSNAIKFTPAGGRIIIAAKPANSSADFQWRFSATIDNDTVKNVKFPCLEVTVSDTGMGIPQDQIPNLFSKFRQLTTDGQSLHKGSGLGLVITKGIIQSHGGSIFVESQPGEGTTFHFTIPINPSTPAPSPAVNSNTVTLNVNTNP